jgi:hypothetical protein
MWHTEEIPPRENIHAHFWNSKKVLYHWSHHEEMFSLRCDVRTHSDRIEKILHLVFHSFDSAGLIALHDLHVVWSTLFRRRGDSATAASRISGTN